MKTPTFRFESLLRLRKNDRDVRQSALARLIGAEADQNRQLKALEATRHMQLDELRRLAAAEELDVEATASRQDYAARLAEELEHAQRVHAAVSERIAAARKGLLRADQAVRSLEKLAERRHAELLHKRERDESRELEETWRAGHTPTSGE